MVEPHDTIEIAGASYRLLNYSSKPLSDGHHIHSVLLAITDSEIPALRKALAQKCVDIVVRSLDEQWGKMQFGETRWSRHEGGDGAYCKYMIRFLPEDSPMAKLARRGASTSASGMPRLAVTLVERLAQLVERLTEKGILTPEERDELLGASWSRMVQTETRCDAVRWLLDECDDAEQHIE